MPRGPSHSSGGGSSGSSGGSSFSSGGGRYGSSVVIVGSHGSFSLSWIISIVFIAIFCACSFWGVASAKANVNDKKEQIAIFESDAEWYYDAIEKAEAGVSGYYTTKATFNEFLLSSKLYSESNPITGAYEYYNINGYAYYFIVYEYYNTVTKQTQKGETYTCFTSSQIYALNETIEIVYTYEDGFWYSINKNYKLEDNQDYYQTIKSLDNAKSGITTMSIMSAIFVGIEILLIVLFVRKIIKKHKEKKNKYLGDFNKNSNQSEEKNSSTKKCSYCGTLLNHNDTKCINCGATKFDN